MLATWLQLSHHGRRQKVRQNRSPAHAGFVFYTWNSKASHQYEDNSIMAKTFSLYVILYYLVFSAKFLFHTSCELETCVNSGRQICTVGDQNGNLRSGADQKSNSLCIANLITTQVQLSINSRLSTLLPYYSSGPPPTEVVNISTVQNYYKLIGQHLRLL